MKMTMYDPGTPCWADLGTSNAEAAKTFYTKLFDWTFEDMPTPQGDYTMFRKKGRDVAALYEMGDEQPAPAWNTYICVEDADVAGRRATKYGGTILSEPTDVMDAGRMAMIQDPTGAVFAVWEPRDHFGAGRMEEPGALCWFELYVPAGQMDEAETFYSKTFGWTGKHSVAPGEIPYVEFYAGEKSVGGMMEVQEDWGEGVPPHWGVYLCVADIEAYMKAHEEAGGGIDAEPQEAGEHGWYAFVSDPQGAHFGVFQYAKVPA